MAGVMTAVAKENLHVSNSSKPKISKKMTSSLLRQDSGLQPFGGEERKDGFFDEDSNNLFGNLYICEPEDSGLNFNNEEPDEMVTTAKELLKNTLKEMVAEKEGVILK